MATMSTIYVGSGADGRSSEITLVSRTEVDERTITTRTKMGVVLESQPGVFKALLNGLTVEGDASFVATSVSEVADQVYKALSDGTIHYHGEKLAAPPSIPEATHAVAPSAVEPDAAADPAQP